MSNYARANTHAAWYQDNYPGATMDPNCVVLHTTEGTSLPGYSGGAVAPTYTAVPDFREQKLDWFAHFPDEKSARALVNAPGGVQTNTANAIQVELVGTCDPRAHAQWKAAHIFWAAPPAWAIRDLASFVVDMYRRHRIPMSAGSLHWNAYPESYGAGGQRMTFDQWRAFRGYCGHQHVPENVHGDPGALPWAKVAEEARRQYGHAEPPKKPGGVATPGWDDLYVKATELRRRLGDKAPERQADLADIQRIIRRWSTRY